MERVELKTGALYTQGAHVVDWTPAGHRPVLFLSGKSAFTEGKAIRGGMPIIFPWFGPRPEGMHGWARTREWELFEQKENEAVLGLDVEPFRVRFFVSFGSSLSVGFTAQNTGRSQQKVEMALHTYLAVSDVAEVSVSGLDGTEYIDKNDEFRRKRQSGDVRLTEASDRVYLNTAAECVVTDPGWNRRIEVSKTGSQTTVVWNPWAEMADLDNWRGMLCVETANAADNAVTIPPGGTHTMTLNIAVAHGA